MKPKRKRINVLSMQGINKAWRLSTDNNKCLSSEELASISEGSFGAHLNRDIYSHLVKCDRCSKRLADIVHFIKEIALPSESEKESIPDHLSSKTYSIVNQILNNNQRKEQHPHKRESNLEL